jgi:predicted RNA methylase
MNTHAPIAADRAVATLSPGCGANNPAINNPAIDGPAAGIVAAARLLLPLLEAGRRIDAALLREAMETAFGASDAAGAWDWKTAYEACEVASVLFLRKYGEAVLRKAGSPAAALSLIGRIALLLPTHTRRSQESVNLQQFSTPLPLGLAVLAAAGVTGRDLVLEPSAGTGLLAIFSELAGARLHLNEFAETRADLLSSLFPASPVTRFDAAQIDDHLDRAAVPSVVLMNPPFSALAHVAGRMQDGGFRHVFSALKRLAPGGRLVAITGANLDPSLPEWRGAFVRLQEQGRVVFSTAIAGAVYAKHGTSFPTRLTVIDKLPAEDPAQFPTSPSMVPDVATLLGWISAHVPERLPIDPSVVWAAACSMPRGAQAPGARKPALPASGKPTLGKSARPTTLSSIDPAGIPLAYETLDWTPPEGARLTEAIYEDYGLQTIRIPGARAHPTRLVQSAAMASVAPPKPGYRPLLPENIRALLSEAQLETVIYAGQAHGNHLAGSWIVDKTWDKIAAAPEDAANAVRFRRGFMIGDGTGVGKGRQAAAILLDNWLQGRRKAVWISKSDKLIEDAQRDWSALGMERLLITPLSRFAQGKPIALTEGILFATYATLRSDERGEKVSRVRQIVDWLGSQFDGAIIFDESHAMQNAGGGKSERGDVAPSQQGRAGLRLQHALPQARIVYVSATGATSVHNLAYAQRLGLWGGEDFPFSTRAEFVEAIEAGGVAAMEVLARDLRALGLYTARSLSFEGVAYELVEHQLTDEQRRIYDSYAESLSGKITWDCIAFVA